MEGGNEAVKDQDKEKRHRVKSENQTAGGWWAPAAVPTSPSFFSFSLSLSFSLHSFHVLVTIKTLTLTRALWLSCWHVCGLRECV